MGSARVTPSRCKAQAARNASASRQGAAMTCTPIGSSPGCFSGTATIGRPMNDSGWV